MLRQKLVVPVGKTLIVLLAVDKGRKDFGCLKLRPET